MLTRESYTSETEAIVRKDPRFYLRVFYDKVSNFFDTTFKKRWEKIAVLIIIIIVIATILYKFFCIMYPLTFQEKRRVYSSIGLFSALAGIHASYVVFSQKM